MKILAIDPGTTDSAYVLMNDDYTIKNRNFDKFKNELVLKTIKDIGGIYDDGMTVVIEMVASYGMGVGQEVFDTCVWIGRFTQAAIDAGCAVHYVFRMEEKMTLCHNSKARDSNIRQALIDRFAKIDKKNGKGTKTKPDVFYGFSKDIWSAYAVGVTWLDKQQK
jgi:hypothetical protein